MSNAVYPGNLRGLGYNVAKTVTFSTIVQQSPSFVETRVAQSQNPLRSWELLYDVLRDDPRRISIEESYTDLKILMGFYLARQGRFDSFLFDDVDEDSVGPALLTDGSPNLQAQLQLVQDTSSGIWYSPVQQNAGGQFYEDVTDLNGGISVFANSVPQAGGGANYTLLGPGLAISGYSFSGLYLKWVGTPTGPITAQFDFYFRVRFDADEQTFDKFVNLMWTAGGPEGQKSAALKLVSSRLAQ